VDVDIETLTMSDGKISNNNASYGGSVLVLSGEFLIQFTIFPGFPLWCQEYHPFAVVPGTENSLISHLPKHWAMEFCLWQNSENKKGPMGLFYSIS